MDLSITSFLFSSSSSGTGAWRQRKQRPLPVIGSMNLVGELQHKSMAALAKQYGPVMHLKLGEISTVVVYSPEASGGRRAEVTKTPARVARPSLREPAGADAGLQDPVLRRQGRAVLFTPYGANSRELHKMSTMPSSGPSRCGSSAPSASRRP